jgi:hypothetical protein
LQLKEAFGHARGWLFTWVIGGVAIAALIKKALNIGVGPVLQLILDEWERLLSLLKYVEPYLESFLLEPIRTVTGWEFALQPHWRLVFAILCVYLRARLHAGLAVNAGLGINLFQVVIALAVVLVASVGSGTMPLSSEASGTLNIGIAVFPVIGALVFDLAEITYSAISKSRRARLAVILGRPGLGRWRAFGLLFRKVAARYAFAALMLGLAAANWERVPTLRNIPSPGFLVLLFLLLAAAIYWLVQGVSTVKLLKSLAENQNRSLVELWWKAGATRTGWVLLSSIVVGIAILAVDAGRNLL